MLGWVEERGREKERRRFASSVQLSLELWSACSGRESLFRGGLIRARVTRATWARVCPDIDTSTSRLFRGKQSLYIQRVRERIIDSLWRAGTRMEKRVRNR